MKFELKTENENYSKSFLQFFVIIFFLALIIILCDVALKLGIISRNHQIDYNCRLLSVEKSKPQFKKLSRISNLKSKQEIWEFCREVIK
jgi:flagellar biosynthesis protein FlhB